MKKFYFFVLIASGVWWYASHRFNFADALAYAHSHPKASWAPKVEYSVAVVYLQRADYLKAQETFNMLLTDFPMSEYEGRALLHLSEAAEESRDWPASKEAIAKYLEEFPDAPDRQMVERRKELLYNK
jgi:outer membrane protein assembly factor BamD (BamD/ComL family)